MTAEQALCVEFAATTDPGLLRGENEDAYCFDRYDEAPPPRYLAAVADGLGGHRAGEVASQGTIESFRRQFRAWDGVSADRFAANATRTTNLEIYEAARSEPEHFGMQSTVTAVFLLGDQLVAAHVGDCRLYRAREGGVETLTRDHTVAAEMLRLRILTTEQAMNHPARSQLTRSVGADLLLRADILRERLQPGDTFLLCSDGLWSEVTTQQIGVNLQRDDLADTCSELQSIAYEHGAPDNITAVVFRVRSVGPTAETPSRWRALMRRGR